MLGVATDVVVTLSPFTLDPTEEASLKRTTAGQNVVLEGAKAGRLTLVALLLA